MRHMLNKQEIGEALADWVLKHVAITAPHGLVANAFFEVLDDGDCRATVFFQINDAPENK